jgi:hypothetical protein
MLTGSLAELLFYLFNSKAQGQTDKAWRNKIINSNTRLPDGGQVETFTPLNIQ